MKLLTTALLLTMFSCNQATKPSPSSETPVVTPNQYILVSMENPPVSQLSWLLPHIDAALVYANWSQMEPQQGKFDFSGIDLQVAQWTAKGKKVVLILAMNSDVGQNTAMPSWVKSQVPLIPSCRNGGFGYQNFPVITNAKYVDLSRAAWKAMLNHFSDPKMYAYIRTGAVAGENTIPCLGEWPGGWNEATYLAYLKSFGAYIQGLHPVVLFTQNATSQNGGNSAADTMYSYWNEYGFGAGMQALSAAGDTGDCTADWCKNFGRYPNQFHYLQEATGQPLSALPSYVPFALQHGANALEIRAKTLSIAYNPADPNYTVMGAEYRKALGK